MLLPQNLISGDTWEVYFSPPDGTKIPVNGWSLNLALRGNTTTDIVGTYNTSTNTYTIGATLAQAAYLPGSYSYSLYLMSSTKRETIESGNIDILENPLTEFIDQRSHNKIMLDAIDAYLEKKATQQQIDHIETRLDGKSLTRMSSLDLQKLRQTYSRLVKIEQQRFPVAVQYRF